jgi:hypothetical protein
MMRHRPTPGLTAALATTAILLTGRSHDPRPDGSRG